MGAPQLRPGPLPAVLAERPAKAQAGSEGERERSRCGSHVGAVWGLRFVPMHAKHCNDGDCLTPGSIDYSRYDKSCMQALTWWVIRRVHVLFPTTELILAHVLLRIAFSKVAPRRSVCRRRTQGCQLLWTFGSIIN